MSEVNEIKPNQKDENLGNSQENLENEQNLQKNKNQDENISFKITINSETLRSMELVSSKMFENDDCLLTINNKFDFHLKILIFTYISSLFAEYIVNDSSLRQMNTEIIEIEL